MIEFIKENKKYAIILLVLIVVIAIGMVIVYTQIDNEKITDLVPNTLSKAPKAIVSSDFQDDELNRCVRCAGTDYVVWLPEDVEADTDCAKASLGDVRLLVLVSEDTPENVLHNVVPQKLYFSVLGYSPTTDILLKDSGYFNMYAAKYFVSKSSAKISVRTVTSYIMTYAFEISEGRYIMVSASCEDPADVELTKGVLDRVASSFRKFEDSSNAVQQAIVSEITGDSGESSEVEPSNKPSGEVKNPSYTKEPDSPLEKHSIKFNYEIKKDVEDGVLVLSWENYQDEPLELTVFGVEERSLDIIEDWSGPGFYAYTVGKAPAGVYTFIGFTNEILQDVAVDMYEASKFYNMYHEVGYYDDEEYFED